MYPKISKQVNFLQVAVYYRLWKPWNEILRLRTDQKVGQNNKMTYWADSKRSLTTIYWFKTHFNDYAILKHLLAW